MDKALEPGEQPVQQVISVRARFGPFTQDDLAHIVRILNDLMSYRRHIAGCEIERTDFCTCGMEQVADNARQILALYTYEY